MGYVKEIMCNPDTTSTRNAIRAQAVGEAAGYLFRV